MESSRAVSLYPRLGPAIMGGVGGGPWNGTDAAIKSLRRLQVGLNSVPRSDKAHVIGQLNIPTARYPWGRRLFGTRSTCGRILLGMKPLQSGPLYMAVDIVALLNLTSQVSVYWIFGGAYYLLRQWEQCPEDWNTDDIYVTTCLHTLIPEVSNYHNYSSGDCLTQYTIDWNTDDICVTTCLHTLIPEVSNDHNYSSEDCLTQYTIACYRSGACVHSSGKNAGLLASCVLWCSL
jgi:hypothetical protein